MKIIPAIDIINAQPVRLYQGDYQQKEVVGNSIEEIVEMFISQKAQYLHLVDLDGAKNKRLCNQDLIVKIAQSYPIEVEVGGGIRTMEDIDYYLSQGVKKVILGTTAINNPVLLQQALNKYPKQIIVGIDMKDGMVKTEGWLSNSGTNYLTFAREMNKLKVESLIFTDISCDGTLSAPNYQALKLLKATVDCQIIASGGIRDNEQVNKLREMGIDGVIIGKAIYAQTIDLALAIRENADVN